MEKCVWEIAKKALQRNGRDIWNVIIEWLGKYDPDS